MGYETDFDVRMRLNVRCVCVCVRLTGGSLCMGLVVALSVWRGAPLCPAFP
jgi:hypothetical protein